MTTSPTDSEITQAIESLFNATAYIDRNTRWNALVPTDADLSAQPLPQGQVQVTYVPIYEFREPIDFVDYFDNLIGSGGQTDQDAIRVMIMVYCHVMESEFWPTLIWNQLRLLAGEQPSWRFTRTASAGKILVCKYPREKFAEISVLAQRVGQPVGDIISRIWDGDLRNAFSHSGYWLSPDYVIPSRWLSPISRKGGLKASSQLRSYSFDEVRDRYRSARALLFAVASEHSKACEEFNK
jgi:hypothetical protein